MCCPFCIESQSEIWFSKVIYISSLPFPSVAMLFIILFFYCIYQIGWLFILMNFTTHAFVGIWSSFPLPSFPSFNHLLIWKAVFKNGFGLLCVLPTRMLFPGLIPLYLCPWFTSAFFLENGAQGFHGFVYCFWEFCWLSLCFVLFWFGFHSVNYRIPSCDTWSIFFLDLWTWILLPGSGGAQL